MKLGKTLGAVIAAGALAWAGGAHAGTWIATYKGHVNGGYDATGVFGAAESDLSGLAFTATFTYDLELGSVGPLGDGEAADFALLTSTLTIGGGIYEFGPGFSNHIETHTGSLYPFGPGYVYHSADSSFFGSPIFYTFETLTLAGGAAAPGFLAQAVAETPVVNPGDGGPADYVGFFSIDSNFFGSAFAASGDLRPEVYAVEAVGGAVPEPAAWAVMILGFAAAGSALRRRRAALA